MVQVARGVAHQQHPNLHHHRNQSNNGGGKRNKSLFRLISIVLVLAALYFNIEMVMPDEEEEDTAAGVQISVEDRKGIPLMLPDMPDRLEVKIDEPAEDSTLEGDTDDSQDDSDTDADNDADDDEKASDDDDDDDDDDEDDEDDEDGDDSDTDDSDADDSDTDEDDEDDLAMDKDGDLDSNTDAHGTDKPDDKNENSRIAQKTESQSEKTNLRAKKDDSDDSQEKLAKSVAILGERSSGTTWIFEHLTDCFSESVPIRRRLNKYKHWFQVDEEKDDFKDTSFETYPDNSLVITMFRNPYDWTEAMHRVPHHAPAHIDLPWKEFVTKTWTTERVGQDLEITDKENFYCQDKFRYHEVVSCIHKPMGEEYWKGKKTRFSEHQPVYELKHDGSGEPYDNILDMRADKIRNFMEVANFKRITEFWVYKYEDLLKDGTEEFLQRIEKATGVKRDEKCVAAEPQNRRKRPLDKNMVKYLDEHLDWEAEGLAGYKKGNRG